MSVNTPINTNSSSTGASTLNNVSSTYGWDTVFAMPIADVNSVIAAKKSSPTSFQCQIQSGI